MNKAQYALAIRMLGVPGTVTHKKDGTVTTVPKLGVANARKVNDANVVNEYGINARIITILADDIPFNLEKFDVVQLAGETLVLDGAIPVHEMTTGNVIGWRGFVRGK